MDFDDPPAVAGLLEHVFQRAVRAAAPETCLAAALAELAERRPALVLGAGKAAAAMAATFCAHWDAPVHGRVVTRYGHGLAPGERAPGIEIVEAGHPSPDDASLAAGRKLLAMAAAARPDEPVYWLVSGGGSALAAVPLDGLSLEQKRSAAVYLARRGADIREINCVRKHLSGLKGGRLARRAHPAPVTTFAISDVPGDDVGDIASGPTIPDRSTQAEALSVLERYEYPAIAELAPVLSDPRHESPKSGDPAFAADRVRLIASAATALDAAADSLRREGFQVQRLGDDLDGEAQTLGREHARLAMRHAAAGARLAILSGGETRVVLGEGGGLGGRNLEYLAGLALELDAHPRIYAIAADTDGIDGHGGHAGGIVTPGTLAAGEAAGVSLAELAARHDTHRFFSACGALVETGPTRTNVNDFRLILCLP